MLSATRKRGMMATFTSIGLLDLDAFPEALDFFPSILVEVDEGDESLPYEVDFAHPLDAISLVTLAKEDNLYTRVLVDSKDMTSVSVFRSVGWEEEEGYHSSTTLFVRVDE